MHLRSVKNQIINLYGNDRDEFLACFSKNGYTLRERRHKLIKYVKMFIGNQIAYSLYLDLKKMNIRYHIFKFKVLRIEGKIFVLFHIDSFIRLIKVEEKNLENNIYMEYYKDVIDLNGYKLIYTLDEDLFTFDIKKSYIRFIIVKNDVVYAKNKYYYNGKLNVSIENTFQERIQNEEFIYNELKIETPGLSEELIKDKLDSIFILNALKES